MQKQNLNLLTFVNLFEIDKVNYVQAPSRIWTETTSRLQVECSANWAIGAYFMPSVQFQSHAMVTKAYCEPLLHQTLLSWATFNSCLSVYITLLKTPNVISNSWQLQKNSE